MRDRIRRYVAEIKRRILPSGTLGEQTAKSGVWAFAANASGRLLTLLMFVILARELSPTAFGIYGIAVLVITGVNEGTTTGLREALIHHEDENVDLFLDTAWVVQIVRGLFIGGVLFVAAPFAASFFNEPSATTLIRVMAIGSVVFGFRNPGIVYFHKSLDFHSEFVYKFSSSFAMFAVALGLGYLWGNVWALALAFVTMDVVKTVVSYVAHDYRPRPAFRLEHARELIGYGKWITGNSILFFLFDRGDDVLVGWLLSSAALGYYQFAYRLSNAPASEVSRVVGNVMFPTFSRLQDDPAALRSAFLRSLQMTTAVTAPMAFGIIAVAPTFVRGVLGEQWVPMITVLQLLAVFGLLRAITTAMGALWRAVGRPDYATKTSMLKIVLMAAAIIPAIQTYGLEGAAYTIIAVMAFPILPLDTYLTVKQISATYRSVVLELLYPTVAAGLMAGVVIAVRESLPYDPSILTFVFLVLVGGVSYVLAVGLLSVGFNWKVRENVQWVIRNVAG
jgi:PST family polysaccharide transporter/lipopolysaccharide exporter